MKQNFYTWYLLVHTHVALNHSKKRSLHLVGFYKGNIKNLNDKYMIKLYFRCIDIDKICKRLPCTVSLLFYAFQKSLNLGLLFQTKYFS